jgi:hypothetical protein
MVTIQTDIGGEQMRTLTALILLAIGSSVAAFAAVPEIDPASGASALALIACAVVVIRARRAR